MPFRVYSHGSVQMDRAGPNPAGPNPSPTLAELVPNSVLQPTSGQYGGRFTFPPDCVVQRNVWFIGTSGSGKTTTVGRIARDLGFDGEGGPAPDTLKHKCCSFTYLDRKKLHLLNLHDTRGGNDVGTKDAHGPVSEYTVEEVFNDMARRHYSDNVVVVVMNYRQRATPQTVDIIETCFQLCGAKLLLLCTNCYVDDATAKMKLKEVIDGKIIDGVTFRGVDWPAVDAIRKWDQHTDAFSQDLETFEKNRTKILDSILQLATIEDLTKMRANTSFLKRFLNRVNAFWTA